MKKFILSILAILFILSGCSPHGTSAKDKWIVARGDLHCHSSYSHDGKASVDEVKEAAKKAGLDFIFLTEHNTKNHLKEDHSDSEIMVLPGYEWTMSTQAHINVFGIRDFPEATSLVGKDAINEYIAKYHDLGGWIQLNHPFDKKYNAKVGMDFDYDQLEIWNGGFKDDDQKAMDWWQDYLSKGNKLVATGGTDKHDASVDRYPVNFLLVKEKTPEAIYDAIHKGHLYVCHTSKSPTLTLSCGESIMGDTVPYKEGMEINIELDNVSPGSIIKVYTEKGKEIEETINEASYKKKIPMEERLFYRVEVWTTQNQIELFSNPIYISK